MKENSSVSEHILRMSGYHSHLTQLGVNLPDDGVIDRVLQSLPPSYKSFLMNYNMQGMDKTIAELFAMLEVAEGPLVSRKRAKERRGTSRRMASKLPLPGRSSSLDLSLKLSASTTKGLDTGSGTAPSIWRIRMMAK